MIVAWVALALGVANVVAWSAVVLVSRRLWRRVAPQVAPLLTMFAPAASSSPVAKRATGYTNEWP